MTESSLSGSRKPTKVAVLGGGCGGLAAAWQLTSTPALRRRFDVTVYQLGWRLGGKGASGRMPHTSSGCGQRIEEHGLHIWFGFYEHAFRMLRRAYDEAGMATGEDWWKSPFEKCNSVSLYEHRDDDTWVRQSVELPRRGGADLGPPTEPRRRPLARVIARTTRLVATGLRAELDPRGPRRGGASGEPGDGGLLGAVPILDQIAGEMERLDSGLALDADSSRRATRGGERFAGRPLQGARAATIDPLLDRLLSHVRGLQREFAEEQTSDRVRLWRGVLELVTASLAGIVRDDVLWLGFETIDEEDFREWLGRHGASKETLARSPVLRGLYDLTFAYRAGDKQRPSLAAGKALQSMLMMINYEGSFMWRMRAGMGDVVFAPLYLALKQRGVEFRFFSEVRRLRLMAGRPVVDAIDLIREASVTAGVERYDPIKPFGQWWCWPAAPYSDQLTDFEPKAETLTRGSDFDEIVLAIPVEALTDICGELAAANPRFKQMLEGAETVRTKALQVWLTKPIGELRGRAAMDGLDPPATAYSDEFDTYCDMSHLLEAEGYEGDEAPKGVAYFCAVLPDGSEASLAEGSVRTAAVRYLEKEAEAIWPGAFTDGAFDWGVVFDPLGRAGSDRLDAQYVRANVAPTDRYVTTPAGSVGSRLDPDQSGFENLVLAGDWTHSGIDGGCVEAAVISGERAAAALLTRPASAERAIRRNRYVDYGALATAPGPLLCERARLHCFFVKTDRARVQRLCDRVLKEPTGGALRYRVPRLAPVILSFGMIAGLRSLHFAHSGRGSASEPEAAVWVPTIAQRFEAGRYVDDHLAVFMPYIWVDDPIAFASGREVYGFAKTQGWMRPLGDPRAQGERQARHDPPPDPPDELVLDVHGAAEYGAGSELGRHRLITIHRRDRPRRGIPDASASNVDGAGVEIATLVGHCFSQLEPDSDLDAGPPRRSLELPRRIGRTRFRSASLAELLSEQVVRHVFLKQIRDAEHGELAALQQVVEARSSVTPGSLRWRRLRGSYDLAVSRLVSHPLEDELGLAPRQTIKLAFAAEFGFRMESGVVRWP